MRAALICAIFGDEEPRPLPPGVGVDSYLLTDSGLDPEGWQVVRAPAQASPRLAARQVKALPWRFVPGYDTYVWIDGSVEVLDPGYPEWAAGQDFANVAAPAHPDRDCIYDEAEAAAAWPKYACAPAMVEPYRAMGHPPHWGLWATTTLAWRDTPLSRAIAKSWWSACNLCVSDQVSLPHVCKIHYARPHTLPLDLNENRWFRWHPHDS